MFVRISNQNANRVATGQFNLPQSSFPPLSLPLSLTSTHTRLSVVPFFPLAMASPDVVASALLLPIPLVSLLLLFYNWLVHRSTPIKIAIPLLLAILAAASGGTALGVACGEPLRVVAKVFANLLHAASKLYCSCPPLLSRICDIVPSVRGFYIRPQPLRSDPCISSSFP